METKRETKEFKTSGGNKVVYKTYITGRESNEIQSVYLKDTKVNLVGQEVRVDGFNPTSEFEANKVMLGLLVVSLNDDPNDVASRLEDLPNEEYQEVLGLLAGISGKKKVEK